MHASVQHKPFTTHSMSIKVATALCVVRHSENQKIDILSFVMVRADLKRFCYMHWHFWIRTKVTTVVSSVRLHSNGFVFLKPALAQPCGKYIQKTGKLRSNYQKNQSRSGHSNRAWLVYKLECLCVCSCVCFCVVVNSESRNTFGKGSQCATITMSNHSNAVKIIP